MICGRFDTLGRPYIEGFLSIPSLVVSGPISFLVDTGSDSTVLFPGDAKRLNVDVGLLDPTCVDHSLGAGGSSLDYLVPAGLILQEDNGISHAYSITLRIPEFKTELLIVPSLIGRDVLKHWNLRFDFSNKILQAEVYTSDRQFAAN